MQMRDIITKEDQKMIWEHLSAGEGYHIPHGIEAVAAQVAKWPSVTASGYASTLLGLLPLFANIDSSFSRDVVHQNLLAVTLEEDRLVAEHGTVPVVRPLFRRWLAFLTAYKQMKRNRSTSIAFYCHYGDATPEEVP